MTFRTIFSGFLMALLLILAACGNPGASNTTADDNSEKQNETENTAQKAKPVELKLGHMSAPEHAQQKYVFEPFAAEVEQLTDGSVTIKIFPGAALASPPASYDAAVTGIGDIMWGLQGYTAGRFPLTSAIGLPFIEGDTAAEASKTLWDLYDAVPEIQEEYSDVKVLWLHASDPYQIVTKGKQVKTLEDLKGLKLRLPPRKRTP